MVSFIGEVVRKVLESMEDSHAQVRMATFKFMLTSSNFVQGVQLLYHHRFVHVFCNALDNEQDLNVKVWYLCLTCVYQTEAIVAAYIIHIGCCSLYLKHKYLENLLKFISIHCLFELVELWLHFVHIPHLLGLFV